VLITNSLNSDTLIHYFDTTSYLLRRSDIIKPDGTAKTMISDYRDVDGVKEAYHQEITDFSTGMKQVVNLTLVETNHPVDTTLFASPSDDIKDFHFIEGNKAENIPFQYIEKHIYLPVTINGQQRLWVLDSGAGATVIEKGYADELGLELQGGLTGKGAGNLVDYSFTTLPPFSVRGLEFSAQKAVVIDIAWLFRQWIGMKIAGILGYDFLSRLVIKIDYANQLISFYDPEEFSYSGDGMIIDAPITGSNMFHVPLTVGKEHGGMWNLDLGAGGVGFHYPYAKEHKLLEMPGVDRIGAGAGGSHKERAVRFATVTFAGFTVPDMVVTFPTEEVEGAFSHSGLTGNIGNELLQHFTLYLDYARERVIVEKGKDFDSRFRRDNSGMQIYNREDGTTAVMHVAAGTPAEDAGFIAGDVILLANGKTPDELGGILALKELLKDDPGTVHTFVVNRDGVEVTLRLALRDLYSDRQ
jgi:hypothetical protein